MNNNKLDISLHFLKLSHNYLSLVRNALEEAIKQGNVFVVIKDHEISEKELIEETRWSDFNIIVPIFYNFYHGLELLMKGSLILIKDYNFKKTHDIKKLLNDFCTNYKKDIKIIKILNKYADINLMPKILSKFLKENKINVNKFYIFLRYPFDKRNEKKFSYYQLHGNEEEGLNLFKEMVSDIDILIPKLVKLYREKEKENQ